MVLYKSYPICDDDIIIKTLALKKQDAKSINSLNLQQTQVVDVK